MCGFAIALWKINALHYNFRNKPILLNIYFLARLAKSCTAKKKKESKKEHSNKLCKITAQQKHSDVVVNTVNFHV